MLQSGTLEPRRDWYSIEEVLSEAIEGLGAAPPGRSGSSIDPRHPAAAGRRRASSSERSPTCWRTRCATPAGSRWSCAPVRVGARVRVRIVDQGPGISAQEQERIFLPFYRSSDAGVVT